MRIPAFAAVALSFAALTGCGLLGKKGDDAGAPADLGAAIDAAAAPTAPGAPTGKNAAAIAHFQTETALNEPKVIGQTATPKTSPGAGQVVGTLKTGTTVTRVASNSGYSLIVFPDPNVPSDNLMGWVSDAAFSAAVVAKPVDAGTTAVVDAGAAPVAVVDAGAPVAVVDAGPPKLVCKPGFAPVVIGTPGCRRTCAASSECKTKPAVCAPAANANGVAGTTKVCAADVQP